MPQDGTDRGNTMKPVTLKDQWGENLEVIPVDSGRTIYFVASHQEGRGGVVVVLFAERERQQVADLHAMLGEWLDDTDPRPVETFWIQSASRPELNHKVTRRPNAVWKCSCEDQTNRGGTCRHIEDAITQRGSR